MNTADPTIMNELNQLLKLLALTAKNQTILVDYLRSEQEDDSILDGCEAQTNFDTISDQYVSYAFVRFMRIEAVAGIPLVGRFPGNSFFGLLPHLDRKSVV